jgi:hypothetical protein
VGRRAAACASGRAGQGRAGQGRAGQGRAGQGRAGQGRAGQGRAGQGRAGQGRAALNDIPDSIAQLSMHMCIDDLPPAGFATDWLHTHHSLDSQALEGPQRALICLVLPHPYLDACWNCAGGVSPPGTHWLAQAALVCCPHLPAQPRALCCHVRGQLAADQH